VLQERDGQGNPESIRVNRTSLYGATYWPWIRVPPRTQDTLLVPPGGHVAGIYARTGIERGVHRAPANEEVRGTVTRDLPGQPWATRVQADQGRPGHPQLQGINVLRDFRAAGRGIWVWRARTIADDPQ
jgi:uncharacterized protein